MPATTILNGAKLYIFIFVQFAYTAMYLHHTRRLHCGSVRTKRCEQMMSMPFVTLSISTIYCSMAIILDFNLEFFRRWLLVEMPGCACTHQFRSSHEIRLTTSYTILLFFILFWNKQRKHELPGTYSGRREESEDASSIS